MPKSNIPHKKAKSKKDSENKTLPVECDEDRDVQVISKRRTRSHAKTYNATKSNVNVTDAHTSRLLRNQVLDTEVKVKPKTAEECKQLAMAAQRRGRSLLENDVDSGLEQLQKRRQTVVKREQQASIQKGLLKGSRKRRSSELVIKSSTSKKARPSVSKIHVEDDSFSETEHSHTDLDKNSKMSKLDKSADLKTSSRKSSRQQTKRTGKNESAAELCKRMTGRKKYTNLREKDSDKQIKHVEMHASSKDLEHSKEVNRNNLQILADDAKPHSGDLNIQTEESSSDSDFEDVSTDYRTPSTSPLSQTVISAGVSRKLESSFSEIEISPVKQSSRQNDLQLITNVPFINMKNKKSENLPKEEKQISDCDSKGIKDSARKQCQRNKLTLTSSPDKVVGKFRPAVLTVDEMDVTAVLLKMEGKADQRAKQKAADVMSTSENSEESDWEEVEEYKHSPVKSQIPDAPVEITINDPTMLHKKRQKKAFDWRKYVQRRIQRLVRETQMEMHKVHLLCLLSHGMQQNSACNNEEARAFALSLISPEDLKKNVSKHTTESLQALVKWFKMSFSLDNFDASSKISLISPTTISSAFAERTAHDIRLFVMMLIVFLRVMGFNVRLVMSLHPLPMKLSNTASNKGLQKKEKESKSSDSSNSPIVSESKLSEKVSSKKTVKRKGRSAKQPTKKPKANYESFTKKSKKPELQSSSSGSYDSEDQETSAVLVRRKSIRSRASTQKTPPLDAGKKESNDDCASSSSGDEGSNFSEEEFVVRKKGKGKMRRMQAKDNTLKENELKEGSEEEFEKVPSFSVPEIQKDRKHKKANRSILSSSSSSNSPDVSSKSARAGHDSWLEVYMAKEKRWICVDCVRCTLDKPYDISSTASQPLLYVLAFDNKGHVKDITARYAPQWLSQTRKKRVNAEWWQETLEPYASTSKLDDREDQEIAAVLMQKPLPTSIGEYKNHPLYALPRHLLKFEAIYPETSVPVGYIRQEPVYARESVHVLHSRDNWLKEGRTIRLGETAYKRVKSRKRWKKRVDNSEELDLELFGRWQTEIYVPPPAVDGKITKNEYGNVELFQPSMLPGGTVHLRVPALNRVAKKLGIDIAPAMVGWDNHCGYSHPVLDGWIVCKEHKKILLTAWKEDQRIQQQREAERREKRVLTNWTTLTRGLLIKERLKKKFNLMDKNVELEKIKQASTKGGKVATDAQHAWPSKQQQKQKKQMANSEPKRSQFSVETM